MKIISLAVVFLLFVVSFPLSAMTQHVRTSTSLLSRQMVTKIDLNRADVSVLTQSFKGIGKKRAEAIVNYRREHGDFKSVRELEKVRGLGKSFVNRNLTKLREIYTVDGRS